MSKVALLSGAVFLLAVALVVALVTRPTTPGLPQAAPPAPLVAPAIPAPADSALAKDSTDPTITGFLASFRDSSIASCKTSLMATLKSDDAGVALKASAICACASDQVVDSLTVGEVHAAALGAVNGDATTNPTFLAMKSRFLEAGKTCMAKNQKP